MRLVHNHQGQRTADLGLPATPQQKIDFFRRPDQDPEGRRRIGFHQQFRLHAVDVECWADSFNHDAQGGEVTA
ncbi:hypothetical protein D3C86_2012340 [compost metagenome]